MTNQQFKCLAKAQFKADSIEAWLVRLVCSVKGCKAFGCNVGHQRVTVPVVAVGRSRADPGGACGLGEGEARWAFFSNQVKRRLDQGFAQIAVMVAAAGAGRSVAFPGHAGASNVLARVMHAALRGADRNSPEARRIL